MKEICLLGANERSCYSVAKSLKNRGYFITVIDSDSHAIRYSKYVDKFLKLKTDITRNTFAAKNEIIEYLKLNKVSAFIPVNDIAVQFLFFFRQEIQDYTIILNINVPEVLKFSHNKYCLWKIAKELGIPVPDSVLISSYVQFQELKSQLKFPIIARPIYSRLIKDDRILGFSVKKIKNLNDLENFVREKINTTPLMLQEVLVGQGAGYNFLSTDGNVLKSYAHERINEEWGGGQSTLRKSIPVDHYNLNFCSKRLVNAIRWSGIAMIEYKICDGKPYLIEINGRPWGSLEVGMKAGIDLPSLMANEFLESNLASASSSNVYYKEVFVRNLYNELIWILRAKSLQKFIKWLFSLRVHYRRNYFVEDSLLSDFKFRFFFITDDLKKILKKKFVRKRKLFSHLSVLNGADLKVAKSIAFLCKGNINRSAFAAAYFNKYYGTDLNVRSYGTHNEISRMCSREALSVAAEFGVDLTHHLSDVISPDSFAQIDKLIIMDEENLRDLFKLNMMYKNKICKLAKSPIADPYGKEVEEFRKCFSEIKDSIDKLTQ